MVPQKMVNCVLTFFDCQMLVVFNFQNFPGKGPYIVQIQSRLRVVGARAFGRHRHKVTQARREGGGGVSSPEQTFFTFQLSPIFVFSLALLRVK